MISPIISASILSADFAHLADDVRRVAEAGIHQLHFDVMDHHYVPNLSFGAVVCQSLRNASITLPIDVHLMVENPEKYIEPFATAGANAITFHPSTVADVAKMIDMIESFGMQAGIAINPNEAVDTPPEILRRLNMVLIMSVYPGFGGQSFIESSITKIAQLRRLFQCKGITAYVAVDGGVKSENIQKIHQAGADFFVIGSGIFGAVDYKQKMQQIKQALALD